MQTLCSIRNGKKKSGEKSHTVVNLKQSDMGVPPRFTGKSGGWVHTHSELDFCTDTEESGPREALVRKSTGCGKSSLLMVHLFCFGF